MIHLHARSSYSLLNSTLTIQQLVKTSKMLNFSACALTDNNVMFGAYEFYKVCEEAKIKPIFGLEVTCELNEENVNFLLIAKNNNGYRNCILCSSYVSSSQNQLSFEQLKEYAVDNVVIVYGEGGVVESALVNENESECKKRIREMLEAFDDCVFALSLNDASYWKIKNQMLKKHVIECGGKTVALSKIYYETEEDAICYKIVSGIRLAKTLNDYSLPSIQGRYIRSKEEMEKLYDQDDLQETENIAKRCNFSFEEFHTSIPKFKTPNNIDGKNYLTQLCIAGLKKRLDNHVSKIYADRLKYELDIIISMHFEDYFLIVYDFIRFAKKEGIYVGPGRGSAAGSLVAYCLGITHVDPIEHNLLFERFLNPERISMPDIDTDFPDDRRDEVIQYVYETYGKEHIAHIITFGTLAAKQVLRDVGRVLDIPLREIDMICKAVPFAPKMTLKRAYDESSVLRQYIDADRRFTELFKYALKLEGLPRHASTHAAGIVMSSKALNEVIPTIQIEQDMVSTQYTMEHLESLGLIKMDFLGLRNLTIIDQVVEKIKLEQPNFNILQIPLDNKPAYDLVSRVDTVGVFQLESNGMKSLVRKMEPTRFEDIVATIALFRPGPMENIPLYLEARKKPNEITYLHPNLEPILKDTYGIMIYQEQTMQVAQVMAGFSLGKADILRKAMSKKKVSDLKSLEEDFIQGCLRNGYNQKLAHELFDLILKFAGYGFNKAHSVAYGLIAYQMAYLKANYPYEFYCALLNSVIGSESKTAEYIDECRKKNIVILSPSVNYSTTTFDLVNHEIRFPLLAIKNVGGSAITEIIDERSKSEFTDFHDFIARIMTRKVNRKVIECLIDAGALDEFKINRKSMLASLDDAIRYADLVRIETDGQSRIDLGLVSKPVLYQIKEDPIEKSDREKAVLGFYLGSHPIIDIKKKHSILLEPLVKLKHTKGFVKGFCCILRMRQHRTKKGDLMAFVQGYDESGELDLVFMPNIYQKAQVMLQKGNYIYFEGKVDEKESCLVNKIQLLEDDK
ncbi:DNA polymerase III subunit alpha [Anaerorhabdus furcosa]|uniref:DNA-directed DNA polymerase n=1 Tax=Anaerorhabdus furcosa TaxID=118967 RepID=A0A1T4Q8U5_9FIRM|nr:DNA polymerase III subunit alpha [Anaerorhabdus furcosa]SJZ99628.1 DNA polymerase-3 subunit alpha [Anaerorhabdus furcosa]